MIVIAATWIVSTGVALVGVYFIQGCALHWWNAWESYSTENITRYFEGSPPTEYATGKETSWWQVRTCRRCGREERRMVGRQGGR